MDLEFVVFIDTAVIVFLVLRQIAVDELLDKHSLSIHFLKESELFLRKNIYKFFNDNIRQ